MERKPVQIYTVPPLHDYATLEPNRGCLNCRHLNRANMAQCTAYPEGIPYPIISGEIAHDKPLPGDNGIQWEAASDAPSGLPPAISAEDLPLVK